MSKAKSREIELRFLARKVPLEFRSGEGIFVLDRYIPHNAEHCYLRVRKQGSKMEITKKISSDPSDLSKMVEYTIPISELEFDALSKIKAKEVAKRRFNSTLGRGDIQVGIFERKLRGLILIDVEFRTAADAAAFERPDWFIAEVTNDKRFAGGELCGKSIRDLSAALKEYGLGENRKSGATRLRENRSAT